MEEPSSVIVPINSTATFYCAVSAQDAVIEWNFRTSDNIDYTLPDHSAHAPGNPNITIIDGFNGTRVKLSIEGLPAINGSEIKCTTTAPTFYQSGAADFIVYGEIVYDGHTVYPP